MASCSWRPIPRCRTRPVSGRRRACGPSRATAAADAGLLADWETLEVTGSVETPDARDRARVRLPRHRAGTAILTPLARLVLRWLPVTRAVGAYSSSSD